MTTGVWEIHKSEHGYARYMLRRNEWIGLGLVILSLYIVFPLIDSILLGIVTAYSLRIIVDRVSGLIGDFFAEKVVLGGFFGLVSIAVYFLVTNAGFIALKIVDLSQSVSSAFEGVIGQYDLLSIAGELSQLIGAIGTYLQSQILSFVTGVPEMMLQVAIYFFVVYVFYRQGDMIDARVNDVVRKMPEEDAETVLEIKESIARIIRDFFVVYGLFGLIMATIGTAAFYVIGMVELGQPIPFYWLWGILIGISAFLEGISAMVFTVPLTLYYFSIGQFWLAVWLCVFQLIFLIILPGTLILPYLGASRLKTDFLTMALAFTAGPIVFGLKGIILGPLLLITTENLIMQRVYGAGSRTG